MPSTPVLLLPYPASTDPADVPADMQRLANRIETVRGAANGLASLDGTSKIPSTQLPSGVFVPTTAVGAASGVASLDATGKVPVAQLPSILPTGAYVPFGGTVAPSGFLMCDGASYLRTAWPDLFAVIGTAYGAVDGTHFNVPDMGGRGPVGVGTHVDVNAPGKNEGLAIGSRRPRHNTSIKTNPTISTPTISRTADVGVALTAPAVRSFTNGSDTPADPTSNGSGQDRHFTAPGDISAYVSQQPAFVSSTPTASGGSYGPQTGAEPTDSAAYLTCYWIIKT